MKRRYLLAIILACNVITGSARAYEVTFEDQPKGPDNFPDAGAAQNLKYSFANGLTADFQGGVTLTNESDQSSDQSNVYATSYLGSASLQNPLTITFSKAVTNFQVDITNAFAGNYEIYDNKGDTKFFSVAAEGASTITEGFATAGTEVSIKYLENCPDFAIDNVVFDQPVLTSTVPLPASAPLLGAAIVGLGVIGYGRRRKTEQAG